MKIIECPRCKGDVDLETAAVDQDIYTCDYCGARIRYRVKSKDAINGRVRVKAFEHAESMADKQHDHEMDVMEKAYAQEVDRDRRDNKATLAMGAVCVILAILGFGYAAVCVHNEAVERQTQAQISKSAEQIRGMDHEIIESEFRNSGFTNIDSQGLGDKGGWFDFATDGAIDYVSVNGNSEFKENTWFEKDSAIIIKYHSFPDQ